jgi:hypothetical protein
VLGVQRNAGYLAHIVAKSKKMKTSPNLVELSTDFSGSKAAVLPMPSFFSGVHTEFSHKSRTEYVSE